MSKLIIVDNIKSGVGNTTISIHIALGIIFKYQKKVILLYWEHDNNIYKYLDNTFLKKNHLSDIITMVEVNSSSKQDIGFMIKRNMKQYDYVILDGCNEELQEVLYPLADIIVTPISDSVVDLSTIATVNNQSYIPSLYASNIWKYKIDKFKQQREALNWVIVLNRYMLGKSNNRQTIINQLNDISKKFGIKYIQGMSNRIIYQSLFAGGDNIFTTKKMSLNIARSELKNILNNIL